MLSCSCDTDYMEWYYYPPGDFITFDKSRRKRCCSCQTLIDIGSLCLKFDRHRSPLSDIEERILGEEVGLASHFMCDVCGEIFLNLNALGYCINLGPHMKEYLEDYWNLTGFKPVGG